MSHIDIIAYDLYRNDRIKKNEYTIPSVIFVTTTLRKDFFGDFYKQANTILRRYKINKLKEKLCQ